MTQEKPMATLTVDHENKDSYLKSLSDALDIYVEKGRINEKDKKEAMETYEGIFKTSSILDSMEKCIKRRGYVSITPVKMVVGEEGESDEYLWTLLVVLSTSPNRHWAHLESKKGFMSFENSNATQFQWQQVQGFSPDVLETYSKHLKMLVDMNISRFEIEADAVRKALKESKPDLLN